MSTVLLNGAAALVQECGTCRMRISHFLVMDLNIDGFCALHRASMHTFRRENASHDHTHSILPSSEASQADPEPASKQAGDTIPTIPLDGEISIEETQPTPSTSGLALSTLSPQSDTHSNSDDLVLKGTNIIAYTGIDKRDGLTSIARRLLRDIPLGTSVTLQKSLRPSDRVRRASNVGLGTVGLSAFLLSTLGHQSLRRELVREMWESGADVLVRLYLFGLPSAVFVASKCCPACMTGSILMHRRLEFTSLLLRTLALTVLTIIPGHHR